MFLPWPRQSQSIGRLCRIYLSLLCTKRGEARRDHARVNMCFMTKWVPVALPKNQSHCCHCQGRRDSQFSAFSVYFLSGANRFRKRID